MLNEPGQMEINPGETGDRTLWDNHVTVWDNQSVIAKQFFGSCVSLLFFLELC
jgi:hypothetical protein